MKSLSDFSPIELVHEDGFILDKDGSQGFLLSCEGIDANFFEGGDYEALHERWRNFLALKANEEIQVVFRKNSDFESYFEKRIEELAKVHGQFGRKVFWKQMSETFDAIESEYIFETSLIVAYRLFPGKRPSQQKAKVSPTLNLDDLLLKRDSLKHQLESMGLKVNSLDAAETWASIAKAANGRHYLASDNLINEWSSVSISPKGIQVNSENFRAITLKSLPEAHSQLGMIQALTSLPLPIELCVRFRGKEIEPLKRRFERKRQILFGLATRKATGDPASEAKFKETDALLRRLNEQNDHLTEMTFTVGLRGKDDLYLRRAITSLINTQSALHQSELEETQLSTFDSYLEIVPWLYGKVFHQQSVLTSNAIHFLPFFAETRSEERACVVFRTKYGSLFTIDPTAPRLANYNWLVSGTSGAGKSFFVNSLLLQSLPLNPRVFIVDIGGSYNKITEFLGGRVLSLETDKSHQVGPFFMSKSFDEKEERRRREHIELVFQEMCRDEGKLPSIEERAILHDQLIPFFEAEKLPEHPIKALQENLMRLDDPKAKRIALLLRRFAHGSAFGDFLDHASPLEINDSIVTFDLKGLKEFDDLLRVVELIVCSAIWKSLRDRTRFTYIVLDEVAFSLLRTQPQFVDELISTVRKHFAGVVICVQGLEKITSNSAGGAILANTNFKAILQQRGDARGYEEPLGLKEIEAKVIRNLERKKGSFSELFLMDDDRRAVLRYEPNSLEYILSTSDPRENQVLNEKLSNQTGSYPERIFNLLEAENL